MNDVQKEAVSYEQASNEVKNWLEYKKIDAADIEGQKESVEKLTNAIMAGGLVMADDHSIVMELKFPINDEDGNPSVTQLKFKPRVSYKELSARTKSVKVNDLEGRIMVYISVLTGQPTGILGHLDTVDMSICQAIVGFFTV